MYPHFTSSPIPSSSSSAASARHVRRPKGLWKARETLTPRWANHTPENKPSSHKSLFAEHFALDHDDDDDDSDSDDSSSSCCKKRRRLTDSPPTSDDEVLYWDYSRKCSPHPERLDKWTTRTKLMDTSSTAGPGKTANPAPATPARATCDLEDWEDLKELFAKAAEIYETQSPRETLPLLRGVVHECHRFMLLYQDPSILYATPAAEPDKPSHSYSPERNVVRDWLTERPPLYPPPGQKKVSQAQLPEEKEKKCKCKDLPTAFYTILGTTLFFFGNLIEQDPSLVMPGEPDKPLPYWSAALDVFEIGENLPIRTNGRGCQSAPEDWRMAIVWGRTLVSVAHEILRRQHTDPSPPSTPGTTPGTTPGSPGAFADYGFPRIVQAMLTAAGVLGLGPGSVLPSDNADEPRWPPNSPFGLIAARRPPMSTQLSITTASPTELLVLAQDQFSRGILHMPHPLHSQRSRQHAKMAGLMDTLASIPASFSSTPLRPYLLSSSSSGSVPTVTTTTPTGASADTTPTKSNPKLQQVPETFSRAKELFTIGSDVLLVAEKLDAPSEREHWAAYADSVFSQMEMELADMAAWRAQLTAARGRCQLVVGTAHMEELESAIEADDKNVWDSEAAVDARDALGLAVGFFEKAREALIAQQEEEREKRAAATSTVTTTTPTQEVQAEIMIEDSDSDVEEGALVGEEGMVIIEADADAEGKDAAELEREEEIAELGKLLGEALLELANLTKDRNEQENLYARAIKVSGDAIELDDDDSDDDERMDEGF